MNILRRTAPAAIAGALGLGLLAGPIPAQAAPAITTATITATTTATSTSTLTAYQLRQMAAVKMKRAAAVRIARAQVGDSYIAGRAGPNAFDCSGLTQFVVKKATGRTLPHYSKAQYSVTKRVARQNLKPGDLVFFFKYGVRHVGMYVGNGKMVHAANPRADVRVDYVFRGWYAKHYSGAGRLIA